MLLDYQLGLYPWPIDRHCMLPTSWVTNLQLNDNDFEYFFVETCLELCYSLRFSCLYSKVGFWLKDELKMKGYKHNRQKATCRLPMRVSGSLHVALHLLTVRNSVVT